MVLKTRPAPEVEEEVRRFPGHLDADSETGMSPIAGLDAAQLAGLGADAGDAATLGQRLLAYVAGPTISNINATSAEAQRVLAAVSNTAAIEKLADATTDARALLGALAAQAAAANAQLHAALDAAQHSLHAADEAAAQIRDTLNNPGGGLSGQPSIARGDFAQRLVAFYAGVFNRDARDRHHVLAVYDRAPRLASFRRVLGGHGRYVAGPTDLWTVHKKCHRGRGRIGLWGFHVWVFKEGEFCLLGDGGFVNWCFDSPDCERDGKKVSFKRLD